MTGEEETLRPWGMWARGIADNMDLPSNVIADQSGTHESTVSRFFTGKKGVTVRQFGLIMKAIGYQECKRDAQAAKRADAIRA